MRVKEGERKREREGGIKRGGEWGGGGERERDVCNCTLTASSGVKPEQ